MEDNISRDQQQPRPDALSLSLSLTQPPPLSLPSRPDLNVEFQFDDKFETCSETIHYESMMTFAANVEPINLGLLNCGKIWCNKHAIFPKGFKSRVRFHNVQDPTRMSNYISEIVGGGFLVHSSGLLLAECLEESLSNVSEMVFQRVNEEIKNHSSQEEDLDTVEKHFG